VSEPVTFGEVENPATDEIKVELGDTFQCPCEFLCPKLSHPWLAAHWDAELVHQCRECGQQFVLQSGCVRLKGDPWASPADPHDDWEDED